MRNKWWRWAGWVCESIFIGSEKILHGVTWNFWLFQMQIFVMTGTVRAQLGQQWNSSKSHVGLRKMILVTDRLNLLALRILYIGQTYRYSTECTFCIFIQQIYLMIFLDFLSPSLFIPLQNVVYFLMLPFLVYKIFTFYLNGVLNCKCPAPGPKG